MTKKVASLSSLFECLLVFKLLKLPETASLFKIYSFDESLRLPPPPRLQLLKNEKKTKMV